MPRIEIPLEPLTRAAFAPFGDVIEKEGATSFETNQGTAVRYHDLAHLELMQNSGRALVSVFEALAPATLPNRLRLFERHPISSQAFIPLKLAPFVVAVAPGETAPDLANARAFLTNGCQGINFRTATWHHPLMALERADFLVIDRDGPGPGFDQDYEEVLLDAIDIWVTRTS